MSRQATSDGPEPEKERPLVDKCEGGGRGGLAEDYQVYFYDPKDAATLSKVTTAPPTTTPKESTAPPTAPSVVESRNSRKYCSLGIYVLGANGQKLDVFRNLRQNIEDPWEVFFMRAEGIHAHGYQAHACQMAVQLAHDMWKNPPNLVPAEANNTAAPHR